MYWISVSMALPPRPGKYVCLVDADGFGNLQQVENQEFDGNDWNVYNSCSQFISYWQATVEDYSDLHNHLEKEAHEYNTNLEEMSKNLNGL